MEREIQRMVDYKSDAIMNISMFVPIYVMHEYYGWGRIRLEKLIDLLMRTVQALCKGEVKFETLMECIKDETGIEYSFDGNEFKFEEIKKSR